MKRPLFWVCVALSLVAVLHFFWSGAADREGIRASVWANPSDAPPWGEERILFSGRVCGKELRENSSYFLLTELSVIQDAAASRQIISILGQMNTDQIQCFPEGEANFSFPKIGSEVIVSGVFSFYAEATNPGEWNTAEYYQGRQIGGRLTETCVLSQSERYDPLGESLAALREYFTKRLEKVFPAREAGILKAMLLGERATLDPKIRELYQDGGILHVLSISGLHVSLLGLGFYELLRRMGVSVKPAAILAGMVLALYGIMTGMSVSACRAIGMFLLRMLGNVCGRTYDMLTALGVMACLMLCITPASAMNSGFWLSFGAMIGVGGILPLWDRFAKNRKERIAMERLEAGRLTAGRGAAEKYLSRLERMICASLRTSASVLLVTLPMLLHFYYEVPVYSTLINLIVIPVMGPVLVFGFLAMAVPGLGFLGTVDVAAFRLFEALCRVTRRLPWAIWNPGCPAAWQIAVYYGALAAVLALIWRSVEGFRKGGFATPEKGMESVEGFRIDAFAPPAKGKEGGKAERLWRKGKEMLGKWGTIGLLLPILLFLIPAHRMTGVVFLDVGQGDCVLLRLSNGQTWLYDCGSMSKKTVGERVLIPYLKHEGIRRVDGIFLSHGDIDHTSGVKELLSCAKEEGIEVGGLYLPVTGEANGEFSEVLKLWAQMEEKGSASKRNEVQYLRAGDLLEGEGISMLILHPGPGMEGGNEASLCLLVSISEKARKQGTLMGSEGDTFEKGKNWTILLTGDVEKEGEEELLGECEKNGIREVTILKCAHHGSRNGTSDAFLMQLDAKVTVISCGRKNSYGHPHEETLERLLQDGTNLFRTDQLGAIMIRRRGSDLLEIRTGDK